jgi:hypothetical protein
VVVWDCDTAQAVELIRALRHELHAMNSRLVWIERQGVGGSKGRACAMRVEAAALRRDITEARVHIERLQRRYLVLSSNGLPGA